MTYGDPADAAKADPAAPLNQLFVAEGERLIDGAALRGRPFPMVAQLAFSDLP